jgi:hypothetical protein
MGKATKIIIITCITLIIAVLFVWEVPRNKVQLYLEKDTIEKTAHDYLNAEKKKDVKAVYDLLAPSSDYKRNHSYEEYLQDIAANPPLSISDYKIIRIYRLRNNDNQENYPHVDKFVQVEVEFVFAHSGPNSIYNYSFTFLKEQGKWYKG